LVWKSNRKTGERWVGKKLKINSGRLSIGQKDGTLLPEKQAWKRGRMRNGDMLI
jgi:hypothetical protein